MARMRAFMPRLTGTKMPGTTDSPRRPSGSRARRHLAREPDGRRGLSVVPGIFVPVKRGMKARIRAMGLDGQIFEADGEALLARAFQHETDHLNGRLLIDQ